MRQENKQVFINLFQQCTAASRSVQFRLQINYLTLELRTHTHIYTDLENISNNKNHLLFSMILIILGSILVVDLRIVGM